MLILIESVLRRGLYVVLVACFLILPQIVSATEDRKFVKGEGYPLKVLFHWHHQFEYAGFYAALMQGYYQEAGLDVSLHARNQQNVVDQVLSNEFQIGVAGTQLLLNYIQGDSVELVFSSLQYSPLVLLSHQPIMGISDLKDRRVMSGDSYEIMTLLSRANLGLQNIDSIPHSANLQDFIDQKVDFYTAHSTNEPFQLDEKQTAYHILDPKSHGVTAYGDFVFTSSYLSQTASDKVADFKAATLRGWQYALAHPNAVIDFMLANYEVKKSRQALIQSAKVVPDFVMTGNTPIGYLSPERLMVLAKELEGLGKISSEQLAHFNPNEAIFRRYNLTLTQQEQAYLQQNPMITLANDVDWAPFEFIDQQNQYQGLAAEYLKHISKMLKVEFQPVIDQPWPKVLQGMKQGAFDLLSCAVATPERLEYLNFTRPYLSFPMVFLTQKYHPFIADAQQMEHQTVAVTESYASHEYLEQHYPNIRLLLVDSVSEGIEVVLEGRAVAYVGNVAAISEQLKQLGGDLELKVSGQLEGRFELAMGVAKDNPVLLSIMQKSLDALSNTEKERIYNNWYKLTVVEAVDQAQWRRGLVIFFSTLFVLIAFIVVLLYVRHKNNEFIRTINELNYASIADGFLNTTWVSDRLCELTGYDRETLLSQTCNQLIHPDDQAHFSFEIMQALKQGKHWQGELRGVSAKGDIYWLKTNFVPSLDWKKRLKKVTVTRQDITAQKRLEELAIRDELTRVYNRRHFNEVFPQELSRSCRSSGYFLMAMIDIDYFKCLNDHFGHQAGDEALQQIADSLTQQFSRSGDFVFRVGGEEFAILSTVDVLDRALQHLEKLCLKIEQLKIPNMTPARQSVYVTVSIGVYVLDWSKNELIADDLTADEIQNLVYKRADEALYRAKISGRNQMVLANHLL